MFRSTKFFAAAFVVALAGTAGIGQATAAQHRVATVVGFDRISAPGIFGQTIALNHFGALRFSGPSGSSVNGGAVLNSSSGFGVTGFSPPNFLAFNCHSRLADGGIPKAPETIDLGAVHHGVSINLGDSTAGAVQVKGTGGSGTENHSVTLGAAMQTVAFSHTVRTITLTPLGSTCEFVADDITFS